MERRLLAAVGKRGIKNHLIKPVKPLKQLTALLIEPVKIARAGYSSLLDYFSTRANPINSLEEPQLLGVKRQEQIGLPMRTVDQDGGCVGRQALLDESCVR